MAGDSLARGAKSATFGPTKSISQIKWDAIWNDPLKQDEIKTKPVKVPKELDGE